MQDNESNSKIVALAETYVHAYRVMNQGSDSEVVVGGRYLDRSERRIAERTVVIDSEQNGTTMMSDESKHEVHADKRSRGNSSYRLLAPNSLK